MSIFVSVYARVETRDGNISYSNVGVVSTAHANKVTITHVYHMNDSYVL